MTLKEKNRKILVTSALPYANSPLHLGHIIENVQTDIWVRYQKSIGNECTYICADDAHGTPIMLKAEELKISPEELIDDIHKDHKETLEGFNIDHANFYTTHSEENRILSELIFNRLNEKGLIANKTIKQLYDTKRSMFLADRYVKGTCPKCKKEDQYGDNCESCSATYDATELLNPYSVLTNSKPEIKESEHLFFKLSDLKESINSWIENASVQPQVVNKLAEWMNGELRDWDISRDAPYFGFPIPGYDNKYFYVWLDAPIGYLASHKNYLDKKGDEETFNKCWNPESDYEIYHFIGKDIMYFHTLFFPAMLEHSDFKTPDGVFVHGFLTLNGEKMSKSRGTFILAKTYLDNLDPEYIRYYFATKLGSGVDDIDLNLEDFKQKVNTDLVGKFINIGSRSAKFINSDFNDLLSANYSQDLVEEFIQTSLLVEKLYESREFSKATKEIMALADKANQYVDKMKPWVLSKANPEDEEIQDICTTALILFRLLAIMLTPILPQLSKKIAELFNEDNFNWSSLNKDMTNLKINTFEPLLSRIDESKINNLIKI
jgi:methionyl-tRNA synthetase|tara:strand:- start:713 stop:2359 length:1647 start_codon:yes stop_codon:yes gene_type:complete